MAGYERYAAPRQAELRSQIEGATEEERTAIYQEIYKLQYQKRFFTDTGGRALGHA